VKLELLRQDPVLESFRITLAVALFLGLLLRFVMVELPENLGRLALGELDSIVGVLTGALVLFWFFLLVTSGFWMRCRRLDLVLPITSRRLWFSRGLMVVAGWLLPLMILTLVIALRFGPGGRVGLDPHVLIWGLHQASWLLLLSVCLQIPGRALQQQRIDAWFILFSSVLAVAALMAILLTPPEPLFILSPLVAAFLLILVRLRRLPAGLLMASGDIEEAVDSAPDGVSAPEPWPVISAESPRTAWWFRVRVFTRMVMNNPIHWIIIPGVAAIGWAVMESYQMGKTVMPFLFFIVLWPWALLAYSLPRVQRFDHLPIARRTLLPLGVLPFLLLISVGPLLRAVTHPGNPDGAQIHLLHGELQVPPEFWELAPEGEAALQVAPWGETHLPEAKRLFIGWSMAVFNPYTWSEESSERFVAWQLTRSRTVVYGVGADDELAASRQSEEEIQGGRGREDRQVGRSLRSPQRQRCLAVGSGIIILACTLLAGLSLLAYRARGPRKLFALVFPLAGVLMVSWGSVVLVGNEFGWAEREFMEVFLPALVHGWAEAMPLATPWLWLLDLLLLTGGYTLLLRIYRGIELPLPKKTFLVEYES
jgi:hypothetical protein